MWTICMGAMKFIELTADLLWISKSLKFLNQTKLYFEPQIDVIISWNSTDMQVSKYSKDLICLSNLVAFWLSQWLYIRPW